MSAAPAVVAAPVPVPVVAAATEVAVVADQIAATPNGSPVVAEIATDVASAATDVAAGKGLSDFSASLVRTFVPGAIGAGITTLGTIGVHIPAAYEGIIISGAGFLIAGAYYLVARAVEQKFPKAGWLLGVPRKPVYAA